MVGEAGKTRRILAVAAAAVCAAGGAAGGDLLIGVNWPADPSPGMSSLLYETGFNYARLTGGGYDWAADRHQKLAGELARHGVKVLLQLGSHYPSADYFRFKDGWFVDQQGGSGVEDRTQWAITYAGMAWPQYSYTSREVRGRMEQDFPAYLARFRGDRNVSGVILHNEPGLFWLRDRLFDYNPGTVAAFRGWLEKRYGSVAALNRAWGTAHASFAQVEPPHEFPPVPNLAAWLDWRRLQEAVIADFLGWEHALVRRTWPGLPTTTNLAGPLDWWYQFRSANNYLHSAGLEFAGVDVYSEASVTRHGPSYALAMTRGVAGKRPFQVLESDVFDGRKFTGFDERRLGEMLRGFVWMQVGQGARGILLWWGGGGSYELTDGTYNTRLGAMREVIHQAGMLGLGSFHKRRPEVAVVVDPDSYLYYGGRDKEPPHFLDKTTQGLYGCLVDHQIEADVIFAGQVRAGGAGRHRALLLAAPVMMDRELASRLASFVSAGGLLIAESRFAEVDRNGGDLEVTPGFGLDRVFGVRTRPGDVSAGADILCGKVPVSGNVARSTLEPGRARVIGTFAGDGAPAVTANRHGKGTAVFLGACVGCPYTDGWRGWASPGLGELVAGLLEQHAPGVARARAAYGGQTTLECGLLEDGKGNLVAVLTVPVDRGKPLPAAEGVRLTFPAALAGSARQAWALVPTRTGSGASSSEPQPLALERQGTEAVLAIGTVESAVVMLLAKDARPLLGVTAPREIKAGSSFQASVSCRNPSPRALKGRLGLIEAGSLKAWGAAKEVSVPAWESVTVVFEAKAPSAPGRLALGTLLRTDAGESKAVPVDCYVK
ncbi:MAG: beta-galactosidase [Candidatus Coatesbacteria bacterium]